MIRINLLAERKQKKQKAEIPNIRDQKRGLAFLTLLAIVTGTTILVMALVVFYLKCNNISISAN